jgi:hypothetical protein
MDRWTRLHETEKDGFKIYVDVIPDDTNPRDYFDCFKSDDEEEEFFRKIENGTYAWFGFRVRVFKHGVELGEASLWACCYADPAEILRDGTCDDITWEALEEARKTLNKIIEGEKIGCI